MKTTSRHFLITAALIGGLAMSGLATPLVAQEANFDRLANLPFQQDYPTDETAQRLTDELLFERGAQSYLLRLPAINTGTK